MTCGGVIARHARFEVRSPEGLQTRDQLLAPLPRREVQMERRRRPCDEDRLDRHLMWWWLRRLVLLGLEIVVRLAGGS